MAKLLQTLIPLLSFLLLAATTARSQSTSFWYDFYGQKPTDLIYQGDAHFPSDSTFLRLTNTDSSGEPLKHRIGAAVYSKPIQFWQAGAQVDFETTVKFNIRPGSLPGDGLAFFIRPVGAASGATGGGLGIFYSNVHTVFAVEFDTYSNPGVDPDYRHVGIDIGSNISENTTDVGSAILGREVTARINYQKATKEIRAVVSAGSESFEVSYVYDLSTFLPQEVEVGISASTGGAVAIHDLVSWYFTSTMVYTSGPGGYISEVV
ncbi:mannose-specific lectin alpha chain-like [Salvia hispanica]|uniref:mannose-specific lectin alpha chain-like n=1 Tax=Salvia hispanica TaxID=49212 RepID=UPI002009AC0B|nr:mannose-specific lectin alpha chain-like [Salvia hispanica]